MKRESIWHKSVKMPEFPPLAADEKADVAIIGGGVTGLLTAHFLREKGERFNLSADARKDEAACPGIIYIIGRC